MMIPATKSCFSWLSGNRCRTMVASMAMLIVVEIVSANVFANDATKSAPWSMFRGNEQHSGLSLYRGPQTATQRWALQIGDKAPTSAAIGTDGTIYVGGHDKHLYAIHPDGSLKWKFPTLAAMGSCPALGADGVIYLSDRAGNLYAIDPDGRQRWMLSLGCKVYSSPTIGANGTIYLGADDHKLHAINPDGTPQWTYAAKGKVQSTAAIGRDGTVFVGANDHRLHAINPDGTAKWTFETGEVIESSPAIGNDGTIYVGSVDKNLYAIDSDGTRKWSFATEGPVYCSPGIATDGAIIVGSFDKKVYCINPNGTEKWSYATQGGVSSSPAIGSDGVIYIVSRDNLLHAINAEGTLLWHFALQGKIGRSPAIGFDQTLYIAGTDGFLHAIGPTNSIADETANALSRSALASDNTRAPFCYRRGQTRLWPILSGELSSNETFSLVARREGEVLAEGSELAFSGISASITPNGRLKITSGASAEKISFELEISLRTSDGTTTSQQLEVRPAPPDRPITYLADLGDDIIYTFYDSASGRFRPIVKGAFDQYFRRLQAHGVSRLIVWQTPFPYMASRENYSEEDWTRYEQQTRAILDNQELTEYLNSQSGGLITWTWQRQMTALRLMREFGPMFTTSAAEHGIKLTASFRPFEPALTKYYEVPTFASDGSYLWNYLPFASPVVNYHPERVCFANYRGILKQMGKPAEAEPVSIELTGVDNARLLADRFAKGAIDLKIIASQFPPIAANSFVLVRNANEAGYQLKRYREIRPRARARRTSITDYQLSATENASLSITGLKIPSGSRYLVISRADDQSEPLITSLGAMATVRSPAGNRLGRFNMYRAFTEDDSEEAMTHVAGISATGGYRTTFQTILNSIDLLQKNPSIERLTDSELVFDFGADWSVEMLDFEQPDARQMAIDQLKHQLSFPAFDEILINTRTHCQLGASWGDGADGIQPIEHYRMSGKNYFHLGIDRAFGPISLARDPTLLSLAANEKTIEQITTYQPGAWSYYNAYQTPDTPHVWRYRRNVAVAAGLRLLFQDLEQAFPNVRIRAVIPPGQNVLENVKSGLETMKKPDGTVYGRDYYRHLWGTLNYGPVVGEGMAMVDLTGTQIEPVFLGSRSAPAEGPFDLYLSECFKDLANNHGSKFRGPRSFFYEAQETLRSKSPEIRNRREQVICQLLANKQEINEVILYEAADWVYKFPLDDTDLCGRGFLDRCNEVGAE